MRRFSFGSLALGVVAVLAAACGGGGKTTATGSGGTTTASSGSSSSKATTGTQVTTSVTGSTSTGMAVCSKTTELKPDTFQRPLYAPTAMTPHAEYAFKPGVALGGAAVDQGGMQFWDLTLTGKQDLASSTNADYATCTTCLLVNVDVDPTMGPAKQFFQSKGTIDIGTSKFPAISGSITDATLVEVTIDPTTQMITVVPGGECLHITSAPFAFDPAPAGWTCDPGKYSDKFACDCDACGIADPDCAITPALPINDCGPGQTCGSDAKTCMGTVTGWTCAQSKYNENHNVPTATQTGTCDCNCGIADPDCGNAAATVVGCTTAGSACNAQAICVPPGWTCNKDFYGDKNVPMGGCDCGCGIKDVDCADLNKTSCDFCDDMGSCDMVACTDAMSKINATNNAVCM